MRFKARLKTRKGGGQVSPFLTAKITLRDLTYGVINSPTAGPINLALDRAGVKGSFIYPDGKVDSLSHASFYLPAEVRLYLQRVRFGDRFECLPKEALSNLDGGKRNNLNRIIWRFTF